MHKPQAFLLSLLILLATANAPFHSQTLIEDEPAHLRATVEAYFAARYAAHHTLESPEFGELLDRSPEARMDAEVDKLGLELYQARATGLRYATANIRLEFVGITLSPDGQAAEVRLIEGHDVVFAGYEPVISTLRNVRHTLQLRRVEGRWKISADQYEDYPWRVMHTSQATLAELRLAIDQAQARPAIAAADSDPLCGLPEDLSAHAYDRPRAVAYAHAWAHGRNPHFFDFNEPIYGGDCTNFVSQALRFGGQAEMARGTTGGIGAPGWYYLGPEDRSVAWTWVNGLYEFMVTERELWSTGPEGCLVAAEQAQPGDVVQYDWANGGVWNHSALLVGGPAGRPLAAAHSPDHDNYPFQSFVYGDYRFLHVARIDGGVAQTRRVQKSGR